ncbi:hypothetical protein PCC7418_3480 [Halothece sp. PCC 7418]|uniref:HpsJ-like protein, cyanoexosortase A-associated n=1 Tax=Halothece sp. (strain PCC 7418) TaxID=65093 RepID=UPI0002A07AF4|nr:HpsJ family protein [Halothece sp. PCC 7418]AFZ45592.1 hypothetical protein PCC7418_3480 [Halothece sp. PCC 7418]
MMKINRFFRNLLPAQTKGKSNQPRRRLFWHRFPSLNLPRIRLPELRPLELPRFRLPELPPLELKLPSLSQPFANLFFLIEDRQGFFILLNWLGYILVLASALDYFLIIYPPKLTNPEWELQAIKSLVSNSWFFLLGLILVFLPTRIYIRRLEVNFLIFLRSLTLCLGIFYILLIPLGVINTYRINTDTFAEISSEKIERQQQLDRLENAVRTQQIDPNQLQRVGEALGLQENPNSENIKRALIQEIEAQKQQVQERATKQKEERFRKLFRQSVRTHFGALLISVFLIRLWWETHWVKALKEQPTDTW